jgi:uroporphyrinogen-III synthase
LELARWKDLENSIVNRKSAIGKGGSGFLTHNAVFLYSMPEQPMPGPDSESPIPNPQPPTANPQPRTPNPDFGGLEVAAFESRHAQEISTLISRYGGVPRVAPSMREIPLEENSAAFEFGEKLLAGQFGAVIFMTGVGTQTLMHTLQTRYPREQIIQALSKTMTVARGPKSVRALKDFGVPTSITLPDPHTWQMLLRALDDRPGGFSVEGSRIAIQEYGVSNEALLNELERRGAQLFRVPVYRWALPEDVGPLRDVLSAIVQGTVRVALFTNAVQVDHAMQVASESGAQESIKRALGRAVVCSVGPICSEALKDHGIPVDIEPEQHKMGSLIYEAARRSGSLLKQKSVNRE